MIDTKWKRSANHAASIEDLRQMYAYARFWNSNKVLLLYPGEPHDSGYQPYPNPLDLLNERTDHHRCKTVHIQVLEHQQLDKNLAPKILQHLVNWRSDSTSLWKNLSWIESFPKESFSSP